MPRPAQDNISSSYSSLNTRSHTTTRSSMELLQRPDHRLSRINRFQKVRAPPSTLCDPMPDLKLPRMKPLDAYEQPLSTNGLKSHGSYRLAPSAISRHSSVIQKPGPLHSEHEVMPRVDTPEHFKGRGSGAGDALSSNPPRTASVALLLSPMAHGSSQKDTHCTDGNGVLAQHSPRSVSQDSGDPITNQSVRQPTSPDKPSNALFAPTRGDDLCSMHAISSYLRREDSTKSDQICSNDENTNGGAKAQPARFRSEAMNSTSRLSIAQDGKSLRPSFQQQRKERTRQRKLRDLYAGRRDSSKRHEDPSLPSSQVSRPIAESMSRYVLACGLIDENGTKLQAGPAIVASENVSHDNERDGEGLGLSDFMAMPETKPSLNSSEHNCRPLRSYDISSSGATNACVAEDNSDVRLPHRVSSGTLSQVDSYEGPSTENSNDQYSKTIESARFKPDARTHQQNTAQSEQEQSVGTKENREVVASRPESRRSRRLAPHRASGSLKSAQSTRMPVSQSPPNSQVMDLQSRDQAEIEFLKHKIKLLEAALMAVLKTGGMLNGCPCGGTLQPPNGSKSPNALSSTSGSKHSKTSAHERLINQATEEDPQSAQFGQREPNAGRPGTDLRPQSAGSNAATVASEEYSQMLPPSKSPLDLYLLTRANACASMGPSSEFDGHR